MGGPGTKFEAVLFKWISSPNQISDVHNHKRCSIQYSSVSIIRAAKVCSGQQDVLPQGPVQPAHGPVGPHSGQPPPLWHNSFHSKKCCSSPSKECCSMCLQHQAWNQWHCRILKMGQNFENRAKFWKWGNILKIGQNFEKMYKILKIGQNFAKRAKFWKSGKILKIGQNFENWSKFWKSGKILKIG